MNAKVEGAKSTGRQVSLRSGGGVLADPAKIIDQTLPGGDLRIPVDKLSAPLKYEIPQPPQQYPRDKLSVWLQIKGDPTREALVTGRELGPITERVWPLQLEIPVALLTERATPEEPTEWQLIYHLIANGSNPGTPIPTDYKIDKTPPYRTKTPDTNVSPPAIVFPLDLPPNKEIDDAYLGAHPGGIEVTVTPAISNAEPTDKCDIYWGMPADPEYQTPVLVDQPLDTGKILMPQKIFLDSKEGLNTLTFVVKDLAGNISRRSKPDVRVVRRLAPPVPLKPIVPLADGTDGDTLIDVADCKRGVTIEVPVPIPSAPSDTIKAYWGKFELIEKPVGANTTLVFDVDYATVIKPDYGVTDGSVQTTVKYEMFRGSGAPITTESIVIDVDISYPGPVNPDEPDEVNPVLNYPRLVSSQLVDNELDDNDYGHDADIFIQLYDVPATEAAQSITVFYDDVELSPAYLLQPGEENTEIKAAVVPWSIIEKKLNATVNIKWRLSAVGGANPAYSRDQPVKVDVEKIELPKVIVHNLVFESIGCPTLNFLPDTDPDYPGDGTPRRNIKVTIPYSTSFVDGRTLTLKWEGYEDEAATMPIVGTAVTKDLPLTAPVPDENIETDIGTYETHLKPVSDAFGKLTYTISGVTPESDPAIHFVFLKDNDDQYCEIANPIP
ncbi:hypothetical protein PS718_03352 [Pseudomonas fluorescens]|uniref:Uncharacterized protein n=1 Tax=Pseudomonas fluorescens TaxID=294 RepID=A0A5E7CY91_PSEFL|nr:hypothetical protein [Pseudomonas fluorescens]VVO10007.1 hypothetical protein PS718_03352 [Pseudomonas fluorescens]